MGFTKENLSQRESAFYRMNCASTTRNCVCYQKTLRLCGKTFKV
jgi:hypothetical protein